MRKAVYAGSFDPITNGHLWMIERASALFDEVVVAVGENPNKKTMFGSTQRVNMIASAVGHLKNVSVDVFEFQYLVDYADAINAKWLVRGLRSVDDFEYEKIMRYVNHDLNERIETIFLMPPRELVEVSSSFVKGLVGPRNWEKAVRKYLPPSVADAFVRKFNEPERKR
jgi:pantetheine-phosphate adenylyltransferase